MVGCIAAPELFAFVALADAIGIRKLRQTVG
jgi:hypothetical protein